MLEIHQKKKKIHRKCKCMYKHDYERLDESTDANMIRNRGNTSMLGIYPKTFLSVQTGLCET